MLDKFLLNLPYPFTVRTSERRHILSEAEAERWWEFGRFCPSFKIGIAKFLLELKPRHVNKFWECRSTDAGEGTFIKNKNPVRRTGLRSMLRYGSHSFTCKLHRTCLYLVSVHQTEPSLTEVADIWLQPPRKDDRLSRPGWLAYSGQLNPHKWSSVCGTRYHST